MAELLSSSQLDVLLHLLASPRPFHLLSESFHASFDRPFRYRAALSLLPLLYDSEDPHDLTRRPARSQEEKREEESYKPLTTPPSSLSHLPSSSLLTLSAVLRPPNVSLPSSFSTTSLVLTSPLERLP